MKHLLFFLICWSSIGNLSAQDTLFSKVYSLDDRPFLGNRFILTPDQGTIQIGNASQAGVVIRTDIDGGIVWQYMLSDDTIYSPSFELKQLLSLTDSTFLIVGTRTGATNMVHNGALICMNLQGEHLWSQTITAANMDDLTITDVSKLNDSTLVLVGTDLSSTKNIIAYTSLTGSLISSFEVNSSLPMQLNNVERLSDTTFVIAGSNQLNSCVLAKYHINGSAEWTYQDDFYGIPKLLVRNDSIFAMTSRGGYTIGYILLNSAGVELNSSFAWISGSTEFDMKFGKTNELLFTTGFDGVYGSTFTELNWVSGATRNVNFVMKLMAAELRASNGYYFLGTGPTFGVKNAFNYEHTGFIKTDSLIVSGNVSCFDVNNFIQFNQDATSLENHNLILTPTGATQTDSTYLVEIQLSTVASCVDAYGSISENNQALGTLAPNPSNDYFTIEKTTNEPMFFTLIGLDGSVQKVVHLSAMETFINCSQLESGTYFYTISSAAGINQNGKLVVMH